MDIKDFSSKQVSFYKYTWEVVVCIVMTDEGYLDPDIWLETHNQGIDSEYIIITIQYKEIMK